MSSSLHVFFFNHLCVKAPTFFSLPFSMSVGTGTVMSSYHSFYSSGTRHAVFQNSRIRYRTQVFMLFHVLLLSLFTNRDPRKEGYIGVLRIRFIGIYVDIWVFSTLNHQWSGKGQDQESSLRNRWAVSGLQVLSVL